MTRVLLINPPSRHRLGYGEMGLYLPTGLLSLCARVRDLCEVGIFDAAFTACADWKLQGDRVVGCSFHRIREEVERFEPDIVGISAAFSSNAGLVKITGHVCKDVNPEITVVVGGADASVRHAFYLESGCCDLCVLGEGESSFRVVIERYDRGLPLEGIEGTAWRDGQKVRYVPAGYIEDLDALPFPAYDAVDLPAYLASPRLYKGRGRVQGRTLSITTSRGCPYSCSFCSIHLHMGRRHRSHSPGYILAHLDHLIERYGIRHFHFEDDNLSLNRRRFEELLEGLEKRGITWEASNGLRVDALDHDLLEKMKAAGFLSAHLPIESGSQRVLTEIIRKKLSLEKVEEVARAAHALELSLSAFYIIGFPGETGEEMKETLDLSLRMKRDYRIRPILLYPNPLMGTRLYEDCVEEGLIDPSLGWSDYPPPTPAVLDEEPVFLPGGVSEEELQKLLASYRAKASPAGLLARFGSGMRQRLGSLLRQCLGREEVVDREAEDGKALFEVAFQRAGRESPWRTGLGSRLTEEGFRLRTNEKLEVSEKLQVRCAPLRAPEADPASVEVVAAHRSRDPMCLYYLELELRFAGEGSPRHV